MLTLRETGIILTLKGIKHEESLSGTPSLLFVLSWTPPMFLLSLT
jgi:hypothetical protein